MHIYTRMERPEWLTNATLSQIAMILYMNGYYDDAAKINEALHQITPGQKQHVIIHWGTPEEDILPRLQRFYEQYLQALRSRNITFLNLLARKAEMHPEFKFGIIAAHQVFDQEMASTAGYISINLVGVTGNVVPAPC